MLMSRINLVCCLPSPAAAFQAACAAEVEL
nr:MAG TPA: hypothetical protein [Caudoviricetes sp.]